MSIYDKEPMVIYTIETAKRDLPQIKIKIGEEVITANISGRKKQFATVWTKDNQEGWEFSWQIITWTLNSGRPLNI